MSEITEVILANARKASIETVDSEDGCLRAILRLEPEDQRKFNILAERQGLTPVQLLQRLVYDDVIEYIENRPYLQHDPTESNEEHLARLRREREALLT